MPHPRILIIPLLISCCDGVGPANLVDASPDAGLDTKSDLLTSEVLVDAGMDVGAVDLIAGDLQPSDSQPSDTLAGDGSRSGDTILGQGCTDDSQCSTRHCVFATPSLGKICCTTSCGSCEHCLYIIGWTATKCSPQYCPTGMACKPACPNSCC